MTTNLATQLDLKRPDLWRFQPTFEGGMLTGGVYLCRKLIACSNEELGSLFGQGYRLATLNELNASLTPFGPAGYLEARRFPQPWGPNEFWHANRFYIEKGIAINGISYGPSKDGCWAVVKHGPDCSVRQGAAGNVELFKDFIDDAGKLTVIYPELAQAIVDASRTNLATLYDDTDKEARFAGIFFGKELEPNEGYLLAKQASPDEIWLHKQLVGIQSNKLNSDNGIPCFSQPMRGDEGEIIVYFAAGGGCSMCNRLEVTTTQTFAADVCAYLAADALKEKMNATSVRIELFPEYRGWREEGMAETLLFVCKKFLASSSSL